MAASRPTSYLSEVRNFLYHLDFIRDLSWRSGLYPCSNMELSSHALTAPS